MNTEDIQLVSDAQEDSQAFAVLYEKYIEKVFNYFWYRVGHNREVAEDLTQEVFVKAFEKLPSFRLRAYSYFSYLLTIAHNTLVNYYRKPKAIPLESVGDIPLEITHEQETANKHDAELLWRTVQQLEDKEKDLFLLRYRKDLPIKDVARIVGKSENAVKISLSRTRKKLANHPHLQDVGNFSNTERKDSKKPARYTKKK